MIAGESGQICRICVMSDNIDGVVIGDDGQCNCCRDAFERLDKEWWPNAVGQRRMDSLVARLKSEGQHADYDAIVGLSGGIDSAYLAHLMAKQYGLRLLAIHVDAGWNSAAAVQNIKKIVEGTGIDLFTHVIEWNEMKDMQRAFLRSGVLNQDFPQDHAFFATLLKISQKMKIKNFLSGVNFASENLHVPHDGPSSTDGKHVLSIHSQFGEHKLETYPILTMAEYVWITRIRGFPSRYRPLDFLNYDKNKAQKDLIQIYGWVDYGPKHSESRFTKFYQDVFLPRKLGFDKRRLHLSSLIVSGQVSREEALVEIANPSIGELQAERDLKFVAKKLDMNEAELKALIDAPLVPHSHYPSDKKLVDTLTNFRKVIRGIRFGKLK
jgi:N-acetyl sugar amidotransferase